MNDIGKFYLVRKVGVVTFAERCFIPILHESRIVEWRHIFNVWKQ